MPFSVVFAVTYNCQCSCVHCSVNDYSKSGEELSNEEIKDAIDEIAQWGVVKVTFFGGEPLTRPDIVGLVSYAAHKGLRVSIDTNGILLDKKMAYELKAAKVGNINVSVDSVQDGLHDTLRKYSGCFEKAVNGIRLCVEVGIPCLISTYASRRAIEERDLEKIIELAKKEKAQGVKILFPILSGEWRESDEEKLTPQEEDRVIQLLDPSFVYIEDALEMVSKKGKGCSAVDKNLIYISPYGDVQPCPAVPISFGNIRKEGLLRVVETMFERSFYKQNRSCQRCIMNEEAFRKQYFLAKGKELPIHVDDFEARCR